MVVDWNDAGIARRQRWLLVGCGVLRWLVDGANSDDIEWGYP